MKIASKILLILKIIGIGMAILIQAGLGIACVAGTWSATDFETYLFFYRMSYFLLISLIFYILPLAFAIYGLYRVEHHKDGGNYMLSGFLVLFFSSPIPGILMIIDGSNQKVEEAEDSLLKEIYGEDECECGCHHDHDECDKTCECHHEDEEPKECEVEVCESKEETSAEETKSEGLEEPKEDVKVETTTSGDVEIEVVKKD